MHTTSSELKRQAREILTGHYGLSMGAFLISNLILMFINFPFQSRPSDFQIVVSFLASFIISLLSAVLNCGLASIHLNLAAGKEAKLSDIFYFVSRHPDRLILTALLLSAILFFTALPAFICTGIITMLDMAMTDLWFILIWGVTAISLCMLYYSYRLVYYLLIEQQELRPIDAFKKSRELMDGKKRSLFYMDLSFIGISILCLLSAGIGFLWVVPYINQTHVQFYKKTIQQEKSS